jgi:hypothetical protein
MICRPDATEEVSFHVTASACLQACYAGADVCTSAPQGTPPHFPLTSHPSPAAHPSSRMSSTPPTTAAGVDGTTMTTSGSKGPGACRSSNHWDLQVLHGHALLRLTTTTTRGCHTTSMTQGLEPVHADMARAPARASPSFKPELSSHGTQGCVHGDGCRGAMWAWRTGDATAHMLHGRPFPT